MTFAEALRSAMTARGLTPPQVAKMAGLTRSAIHKYLYGERRRPQNAALLADVLDAPELRQYATLPRRPVPTALDPELGPVRWCAACQDWWPMDEEFWYLRQRPWGMAFVCKGCARGARRRYEERRAA